MRAPGFWSRPPGAPGLAAPALWPLSLIWRLATALRWRLVRPETAPIPVVCVGNLTAGGAGKTPTTIALAQALAARGVAVHVVSRGHGGAARGPRRVDALADAASEVGDEPLLLALWAPTWVSRDRAAGVRAAAREGARLALLDDGFQNPRLRKDLSVVVVDAGAGFGNGRVIPAGPLREPVASGLARADAAVLIGDDADAARTLGDWPALARLAPLRARLAPLAAAMPLDGADVVAFAGIGRPEKFFQTLRALGARLVAAHAFPDHAPYAPRILRRMIDEARAADAMLVTTEKDAARLPAAFRSQVLALPVRLSCDNAAAFEALIDRIAALSSQS